MAAASERAWAPGAPMRGLLTKSRACVALLWPAATRPTAAGPATGQSARLQSCPTAASARLLSSLHSHGR